MSKLLSIPVMVALMGGLCVSTVTPVQAGSGVIKRACMESNRRAASPQLCGCIQSVANQSLNRSERRKVAKWFDDPHKAQEIRMSDRSTDEQLWKKYKAFGNRARASCS